MSFLILPEHRLNIGHQLTKPGLNPAEKLPNHTPAGYSFMVTSTRAKKASARARRRRNRKRARPIWRRLPDLGAALPKLGKALRRALPSLVAAALTAAIVAGGYYGYRFVTTSERFAVEAIDVRGQETLSDERISTILDGVVGTNIFRVDLDAIIERIEAEPVVASAAISRRLPDTLLIDVAEYQPAALVELGGPYLSDARGHIYKRANTARGDGAGLPVITGLSRATFIADPQAVADDVVKALDALALYREVGDTRPALSDVNVHPRQGITFITYRRATQIRVGHGDSDILRANLRTFDTAWNALTAREQKRVRVVYADTTNRLDRVTVGFEHLER